MSTECWNALGCWLGAVAACAAAGIAYWQLGGVKEQIKQGVDAQKVAADELRISSLMAVLEIESQMSARKVRMQDLVQEVHKLNGEAESNPDMDKKLLGIQVDQLQARLDVGIEDYLNAVDRLCYCILRGLLSDRDWRAEYRNLLHQDIQSYGKFFRAGTAYRNIVQLDAKWQAE